MMEVEVGRNRGGGSEQTVTLMDRYAVDHPQRARSNMTLGKGERGFSIAKLAISGGLSLFL
jgi:hypothetical protein